ncbi:uncharacterized mitochondrial protein AtMg00860-like [Capsicum annuum]|uniref:uncharacterized mitochondrial protein AtMg00860-like n=1 Tax=Capsicum annuum TaxID=4072 RepID=UPI001FB150D0|nr:uncharacterized mitochondrial protein AtMg00860-like [Capsicum annuum]
MIEVKLDVIVEVPNCDPKVLKQFTDVMPPELPKEFSLKRDIDHKIELIPGSISPAQAPYIMASEELKMQTNVEWKAPSGIKELRSFLGMANYYNKFIVGYTKKDMALTDLLKKDVKWVWSDKGDAAFQMLKKDIASKPILKLLDFELPFELQTDASDKAVGGVLV